MEKVKLGDVFELQMGKTPSRSESIYWNNGENKWISIADLSKCNKYIENTLETISNQAVKDSGIKIIPQNTVVMSFKLSVGKVAITSDKIYSNEAIMAFIDKKIRKIDEFYLYYLLLAKKWSSGTNRAVMGITLNKATLSLITINIHSFQDQQKIVAELDTITEVIAKKKEQIKNLDLLVKSQFVEMFGDPIENPKGWKVGRLGDNLTVIGGYAFASEKFTGSGVPVLRIGSINTGCFKKDNLVFWNYDYKLLRYEIKPGDLVVSLTGTVGKEDYGNVCILSDDYRLYYLNQRNAKLELNLNLNKYYILSLLKVEDVKKQLTSISRGVRQANISNKDIENLKTILPPIALQNEFADFVTRTETLKEQIKSSLAEAENCYNSLMQKYFD